MLIALALAAVMFEDPRPAKVPYTGPAPVVLRVPFWGVAAVCSGNPDGPQLAIGSVGGCALGGLIVLPTPETFPYDADCLAHLEAHERAHFEKRLAPDHHDYLRTYVCHPRP